MKAVSSGRALNHQELMDHFDALTTALQYQCLSDPGLAIGTSSNAKVKISSNTNYLFAGEFKVASAQEVAFTATSHDIPADDTLVKEAMYLVCLDASGNGSLHMGDIAVGAGQAKLPEIPAAKTPIGAVRIAVAAGATPFDASTDALSEAQLTDTYYNYGFLAPRFDSEI